MARDLKPKTKRMRNPVATRAKLLQATIELVSEKGEAAVSLKEAAHRAKVSRGVAYLHFDDREQLLNDAKSWISEGLQSGVKRFHTDASLHDRTFYTTRLVLTHPEATKLMLIAAMAGEDLEREHPLSKLVSGMLKALKENGKAWPDIDPEILTYIMFGSLASTVMLGARRNGENVDRLAERFSREWNRILQDGIFVSPSGPRSKNVKRRARKT
jgi:AcrR family transcriptional regulator